MELIDQISKHKIRSIKTASQMLCILTIGVSLGILGPTIFDLADQVDASVQDLAFALSSRSGGFFVGCILLGILFPKINYQLGCAIFLILSAILTIAIPFARSITVLFAILITNGICLGFVEAGSEIFLLQLWGKETQPFMQLLRLMSGTGSLIAPLIAEPFLKVKQQQQQQESNNASIVTPNLTIPYSLIAVSLFINAILCTILWIKYPITLDHPSRGQTNVDSKSSSNYGKRDNRQQISSSSSSSSSFTKWKIIVVILIYLMVLCLYGMETSFLSFLMTFAVQCDLNLSKATGVYLTTSYATMFTFARIIPVLISKWIRMQEILFITISIVLIANGLLWPFGDKDETLLWIGVSLLGIGNSSIWGLLYGFLEQFFPITSMIGSLMVASAILGGFLVPLFISPFIETNPRILLHAVTFCSIFIAITFLVIAVICNRKLRRKK